MIFYAYLEKKLLFKNKFKNRDEPLPFCAGTTRADVKSFGLEEMETVSRAMQQVRIHDYANKDDFVIRINTESDDIVMAKVLPAATLHETLATVRRRIKDRDSTYRRPNVEKLDTLVIPKINFGIDRRYSEIIGRMFLGSIYSVGEAKQQVRFMLNEAGATLVSEVVMGAWLSNGDEEVEDPNSLAGASC